MRIQLTSELQNLCDRFADRYRQSIKDANAVASGRLVNFTTDVETDGTVFTLYYNLPDYYKYSPEGEYNNRNLPKSKDGQYYLPTSSMYYAIKEWTIEKGLDSSNAWGYAFKIANEGWKNQPKKLFEKHLDNSDDLVNEIENNIYEQIETDIVTLLETL